MWAGQDDFTEQECIDEEMPVVAIPPAINYAEFANEGTEEERANARLIAQSPRMYEFIATRARAGDEEAQSIVEAVNASS